MRRRAAPGLAALVLPAAVLRLTLLLRVAPLAQGLDAPNGLIEGFDVLGQLLARERLLQTAQGEIAGLLEAVAAFHFLPLNFDAGDEIDDFVGRVGMVHCYDYGSTDSSQRPDFSRIIRAFSQSAEHFLMVVIRLQRGGANKRPFYHLVVADSRRAASGKFLERVGFYDPKAPEGREALRVDMERVKHWTGQGAQLSGTAARLVKQFAKKAA
jgi:small subunit ribosomal protein S16